MAFVYSAPSTTKGPHYTPSEDIRDAVRYRATREAFLSDMLGLGSSHITSAQFDAQSDVFVAAAEAREAA